MIEKYYGQRRKKFMRLMGNDSIAIIPTANLFQSRNIEHPFRPDSDFMYLTGFSEPEAIAVLIPGRKEGQYILFNRESDPILTKWEGAQTGQAGAVNEYLADEAYPIEKIEDKLPELIGNHKKIFYSMEKNMFLDAKIMHFVDDLRQKLHLGKQKQYAFLSPDPLLHELRLFKSMAEIGIMKKAIATSVAAHKRAMHACMPGKYEYEIEAEILSEFRSQNMWPAYPCIVGGGNNSCTLHYTKNNSQLKDGDLLLVDAGAQYCGYTSDITRTYPVNGQFSKEQREIYEIVETAQTEAIKKVLPGNFWNDPHDAAVKILTKGLVKIGLLNGNINNLIKNEEYKKFYMHRTGHWLGMDVHDVGTYKVNNKWRMFEPGMVLTIEPGVYVDSDMQGVKKKWKNIGIRIEDDILVTKTGNKVLTADLPTDAISIESLVSSL